MKTYLYLLAGSATLLVLCGTGSPHPTQPQVGPAFPFSALHLLGSILCLYWLAKGALGLLTQAPTMFLLERGSEATAENIVPDTTCNNDCSILM